MFDRSVYRLMYTIERSGRGRQARHLMPSGVLEPATIGSYRYGGGRAAAAEQKSGRITVAPSLLALLRCDSPY
jgi:hypothetical protein